ncbi:MAG: response regulator transcription factor [Lachnospiraceae bacterium]|nr:response regulator transcription factor [Lachnospiraceae bacterium]
MEIMIVDDHPLVRYGIRQVIQTEDPASVVYGAGTVGEAVSLITAHPLDLVFVDVFLQGESGFSFIQQAKRIRDGVKYIMLTSSRQREDFLMAWEMRLDGYIVKQAAIEDIRYAIRLVSRGGQFFSPEVSIALKHYDGRKREDILTKREQEVFALLQEGRTNAQISEELFITESTTKKHVSNILAKLNLKHRVEAALYREEKKESCEK